MTEPERRRSGVVGPANGRVVEHWDVVQPYVEADRTASGNPMV